MAVEELHRAFFHSLHTERLFLRPLILEDAEAMFAYTSLPESFRFLRREHHQSIEEDRTFIENVLEGYRLNREFIWGICLGESNQVIGTCRIFDILPEEGSCEVSYLIHPSFQGQGIASGSVGRLVRYAFEELSLQRVLARCAAENTGSERVMQKCGMTKTGTLLHCTEMKGVLWDFHLYNIQRNGDT